MSVIVAAGAAISKSCLNNSRTKQMYSFSKAERFPKPRPLGKSPEPASTDPDKLPKEMYDIPSTKMTRFTKFGYGNRSDFTKGSKNNKSEFVMFRSDFDKEHPHGPKYTFGVGRDKYNKVYIESNKNIDMTVPGPGKYYNPPPFGKGGISYSFRGKPEPKKEIIKRREEKFPQPGPGEYPVCVQINPTGKYVVSGISNISSLKIKPETEKKGEDAKNSGGRFNYVNNKVPGPGEYPQKQLISTINFNSKHRSYGPQSMHAKLKTIGGINTNPGPGQYVLPSEFGLYEAKNAKEVDEALKKKYEEEDKKNQKPKPASSSE